MKPIFFLYARKSSESEERQALSIEAQITELKIFAEKENLTIQKIFTEAQSAKTPGRPVFNEMISCIEKGEANGIIAWHPDRLARNSIDGGRIVYLLDTKHIEFLKCPTFWFENSPQGKFMLNIAFGQSKYYVDNLSENVKRGQRQKLRRGEWPGWAPLGYINDKNLRKVVPDPINAPHVKKLFETYATGQYTLEDLKKFSFEWGLVSRKNNPVVKAEIQRTLKRSFYYGLMFWCQ
jgi:DNA invertase Pin-like site-specific DNA recombinase